MALLKPLSTKRGRQEAWTSWGHPRPGLATPVQLPTLPTYPKASFLPLRSVLDNTGPPVRLGTESCSLLRHWWISETDPHDRRGVDTSGLYSTEVRT